ncbi:hypothetical protein QZM22_27110 [Burkholderia oklahomensis]|nr:hypothetical protein [Burkholderia oklahomensis]MDN7676065.1 hypothetical protein [Burkholderia oklahomensis]
MSDTRIQGNDHTASIEKGKLLIKAIADGAEALAGEFDCLV